MRRHFPLREQATPPDRPPVIVMHGSFDSHHLGRIAFDAVQVVDGEKTGNDFPFRRQAHRRRWKNSCNGRRRIPGFKFEATGFIPYAEVSKQLADASVGIVPYEESAGTHCAFVAKIVEYVASGLPTVCTPLKSVRSYFQKRSDGAVLAI